MHRCILTFAIAAVATGCGKNDDGSSANEAEKAPARADDGGAARADEESVVVSAAELDTMQRQLDRDLTASSARACPRPVLRGDTYVGRAGDLADAIVAGTGDLAACTEAVGDDLGELEGLLVEPRMRATRSHDFARRARALDDTDEDRERVAAILAACRPVVDAARRAVARGDGCSPYVVGVRPPPPGTTLLAFARTGVALPLEARHLAREGDAADGARLLTDTIRFSHDLRRGGTPLIVAMIALAEEERALIQLRHLLSRPNSIPTPDLELLAAELEMLAETVPHPSDVLRAEVLSSLALSVAPHVADEGWTPPGGFPDGHEPGPLPGGDRTLTGDRRNDVALAWMALLELAAALIEACPGDATALDCAAKVEVLAEANQTARARAIEAIAPLDADDDATLADIPHGRRHYVALVSGIAAGAHSRYVEAAAWRAAMLGALRIAARFRLAADEKECPTVDELASLADLPGLGAPLELRPRDGGGVEVYAPEQLTPREDPLVSLACKEAAP